jgi:hypothetical protein
MKCIHNRIKRNNNETATKANESSKESKISTIESNGKAMK